MSIEFNRVKSHSSKWSKKYPRTRINNHGGDRKAAIAAGWYKFNWEDDHINMLDSKLITRFLKSNIGRPIDKVFSEFLEKCDSKLRKHYPLKQEFYSYIEEKEDIKWLGGFYVTNGILNYKKRVKYNPPQYPIKFSCITYGEAENYNITNMPKNKDIVLICEKANKTKSPQYLGNLCVYEGRNIVKKSVYIIDIDAYTPTFEPCRIAGYGNGIGIFNFPSQSRYNVATAVFSDLLWCDDKIRYKLATKIKVV